MVWPFTWQSRQVTPRLGSRLLRSSVGLNSSCGNGVSNMRKPIELDGRQNVLKQPVIVVDRHDFAAGDIAQLRAVAQKDRGRKLGKKRVRQIEVDIEPLQPREHLDLHLRKDLAAIGLQRVRQRRVREQILLAGSPRDQSIPSRSHVIPCARRAVGPTGRGFPRDIFASGSSFGWRL